MKEKAGNPQSQYLKVSRSTMRYKLLTALAEEYDCTWQQIARVAIDWYIRRNPPKEEIAKSLKKV